MPRSTATSTPDYTFLCGKGGVGKTTCAAALAVALARGGTRTLVVSIDPAPSLGDALGQRIGSAVTRVDGVARLDALELDAGAALARWLKARRATFETIALRGTWLDQEDVTRLLRLSLPGVDEIAALLELTDLTRRSTYDRIVVDTAPTGHFLRLLGMPEVLRRVARVFDSMQEKHRMVAGALRGRWTPDAADALIAELEGDADSMAELLRDPHRSALWWVSLPEAMSVDEAADAIAWLDARGFRVDRVVANRVTPPPPEPCAWCRTRRHAEANALRALRRSAGRGRAIVAVAAQDREPRTIRRLAPIAQALRGSRSFVLRAAGRAPLRATASGCPSGTAVPRTMLVRPETRLLMFGGKGGVGKTTCAAAFAIEAARGEGLPQVLLVSTDPAHSLADVLGRPVSDEPQPVAASLPNLLVRELDASAVYARFRERFARAAEDLFDRVSMSGTGGAVASLERQALRDLVELAPPGVDELVAIVEVTDALEGSGTARACDLLVLDTAPSGHALRLLEMPAVVHDWVKALMAILLKYQPIVGAGELGRVLLQLAQSLGRLRERLSDAERTRFVVVTRAAALPRAEAVRLLARLRKPGIHVTAVVVNANGAGTCRRCKRDRLSQSREIARLRSALRGSRGRILLAAPAELPPPRGIARLARWRGAWRRIPGTSR